MEDPDLDFRKWTSTFSCCVHPQLPASNRWKIEREKERGKKEEKKEMEIKEEFLSGEK